MTRRLEAIQGAENGRERGFAPPPSLVPNQIPTFLKYIEFCGFYAIDDEKCVVGGIDRFEF